MCGIAAIITKIDPNMGRSNNVLYLNNSISIVGKCLDAMHYRGPDGRKIEVCLVPNFGIIVFGHLRLSIIDLNDRASQPMYNVNDRYCIIFNGEIYNYKELRTHIHKCIDIKFKTESDTEVLLELFAHYQEKMFTMLNGMFAFIIFDTIKQEIFFARDHVGIKPLYYAQNKESLIFTSEPKAIIESKFIDFKVNKTIMFDFLARGIKDHTDETFFEGIKQVRAGYYGTFSVKDSSLKFYKWFDYNGKNYKSISLYKEHLEGLLKKSIRLRKRSDVEVGTTLSGGLDSSTIASIAKVNQTFTASFPGNEIDETKYAELVCKINKLNSNLVTPTNKEVLEGIERSLYIQGEPTGGLSSLAQYFVFKKVNEKGIKVTLDGQGADELFMGYEYFKDYKFTPFKLFKNIMPRIIWVKMLEKRLYFLRKGVVSKYFNRDRMGYKYQKKREFFINQFFRFSLPHLLMFEDRNSMAFSVESRVPFLDPNIIKLALNQPFEQNFLGEYQKYILRLVASKYLPKEITWRKDKIGFAAPEKEWMDVIVGEIFTTLSEDNLFVAEFIKDTFILELLTRFKDLSKNDGRLLYRIYQAEKWYRIFIK